MNKRGIQRHIALVRAGYRAFARDLLLLQFPPRGCFAIDLKWGRFAVE
jgi:hypothetical protein